MRTRSLAAGAAVALALALLTTLPASAAYQDPLIEFPDGTSVFYSPFSGPATVTFTFDAPGSFVDARPSRWISFIARAASPAPSCACSRSSTTRNRTRIEEARE